MCGIAGIYKKQLSEQVSTKDLKKMTDIIEYRGPDGEGYWIHKEGFVGFGHRRLSIIDLSDNAKQPFHGFGYSITYNGEIYNYIELKDILQSEGYEFFSDSDTEVLLAAYDFWGEKCLNYFDGMWAFAIWDEKRNQLFCARDRFGEKPFHYYSDAGKIIFASEMKSIWALGVSKDVCDYMMYLFINMDLHENPEDKTQTFFKNIKRLKPGHYFIYKKGENREIEQKCYYQINPQHQNNDITFEEACLHFRDLFLNSITKRLRSDVTVGTSLSGGLDSSAVVMGIHNVTQGKIQQKSFSARFDSPELDEGFFMKKVIEKSGFNHVETYPDEEQMINNLKKIMFHQEEPFGGASVFAQWEVFKLAKNYKVTVLLDGQGADEVFAGYSHFFEPYFREIYLKKGYKALKEAYRMYKENNIINSYIVPNAFFRLQANMPLLFKTLRNSKRYVCGVSRKSVVHSDLFNEYKKHVTPFNIFSDLNDSLKYHTDVSGLDKLLRFADRNSMAFSREVRLPFLNYELVDFVFSLPSEFKIRNGWTKALIREGLSDILPEEITWRKNKLGFQPPQSKWENNEKYLNFATEFQNISVKEKYISKDAPVCWEGMVTGLFLGG